MGKHSPDECSGSYHRVSLLNGSSNGTLSRCLTNANRISGPSGLIWGLVVNWIGVISMYATLAELASTAPTAGGQCMKRFYNVFGQIIY